MKHLLILILLLTLNTSFMSKNDKYIIYRTDALHMVVMCTDLKGNPQYTTNEDMCMKFDNEAIAQATIATFDDEVSFFGTRPIRR